MLASLYVSVHTRIKALDMFTNACKHSLSFVKNQSNVLIKYNYSLTKTLLKLWWCSHPNMDFYCNEPWFIFLMENQPWVDVDQMACKGCVCFVSIPIIVFEDFTCVVVWGMHESQVGWQHKVIGLLLLNVILNAHWLYNDIQCSRLQSVLG